MHPLLFHTPKKPWHPKTVALITASAVAVLLFLSVMSADAQRPLLATVPAISIFLGMVIGLLHHRRLTSVLWGTVIGLVLAIAASWRMIALPVEGAYAVVVATLALFTATGFIVGAFVEFVQLLHFMSHGGKVSEYRKA